MKKGIKYLLGLGAFAVLPFVASASDAAPGQLVCPEEAFAGDSIECTITLPHDSNQIYKYTLIGIFIALITSVMILDIMLCVTFENYFLLTISIVIWILLYYLIFRIIVGVIKKEISL